MLPDYSPDAANIVVAYDDENYTQQCVAEALFGAKPFPAACLWEAETIVREMDYRQPLSVVYNTEFRKMGHAPGCAPATGLTGEVPSM